MKSNVPWVAVVDDEAPVCRSLLRLLRSAGMSAGAFSSGLAFLVSLQDDAPACVILDINMPMMNGLDVCEFLRARNPMLPVILLTSHDSEENRARAVALRTAGYLTKPVDDEVLLGQLANVMQQPSISTCRTGSGAA